MKNKLAIFSVVAATLFVPTVGMASESLAKTNNCLACHSVDKKLMGPAFKEISAKYKGQKDAEAKLAVKVIKGGSGSFGAIPMPANTKVSEADAKTLVKWILSL